MNLNKYLKKELLYSKIFILIGVIAAVTGLIFDYHKEAMLGLTAGFLPTGIGTMFIYKHAGKSPKMVKNIELENEERNIFINTKAGYTAFWVSYWYIFVAVILNSIVNISFQHFLIVTLFFMPTVYFLFVFIYHKKY